MLLKIFYKIEREGIFPNTIVEVPVTLTPHKDLTKKEKFSTLFLLYIDAKILNKILVE